MRISKHHRVARCRGFALLIVVTLLAFVVVLLLGLAAYTRVETAVAGNVQRQAQARENALLGLEVALAQLQKHAGPDRRVTATAEGVANQPGTSRYTGVWAADADAAADPKSPLSWLVSGNENFDADGLSQPLAVTPGSPGSTLVELVGRNSTGSATRNADYILAPLQTVGAPGVPGRPLASNTPVGRYAWWVGDQGVKAPVAVADASDAVNYTPFDSADLRARVRQQVALGAGPSEFDARESANATLVANQKVATPSQVAFLRRTGSTTTTVGLGLLRTNFHTWSPNNYAVLANSRLGGLRQDLSLQPDLLGAAFAAWSNYPAYMEPVADAGAATPEILPAYGADPVRRRYVMTPHLRAAGGSHQIGPVLADFGITFNVQTTAAGAAESDLHVRGAWMLSLWNPYTAALRPEDLRIEVSGLPLVTVVRDTAPAIGPIALQPLFGGGPGAPLRISLPWDGASAPAGAPLEDRRSWLPGRIYTWRSVEDTSKGAVPADGYPARFYTRSFVGDGANQGVQRPIAATASGTETARLSVSGGSGVISVRLFALRDGEWVQIGFFESPEFLSTFETTSRTLGADTYQFGYSFRLRESVDSPASPSSWLMTDGVDVRRTRVPGQAYKLDRNDDNPAVYENGLTDFMTEKPDRLLFRSGTSYSYNEDVPLFELPRSPLLSLGALQHFRLVGRRPFSIGNPWGAEAELNGFRTPELFDRFFFSGLASHVTPSTGAAGELLLPNPLLRPLRTAEGARPAAEDLRAAPDARSSKFLLQGGAFNLNSLNAAAWAAVLRGVRFPAPQAFRYLDVSNDSGTAADDAMVALQSSDAFFFRFSQSAQETFKAEPGQADPSGNSPANTHLFRRGARSLTSAEVSALAGAIVSRVRARQADAGPFRSVEEFLAPSALYALPGPPDANGDPTAGTPRSLLEAAIDDAGTNTSIPEFSSQWLTQADLMTALAPILFARSDTFLIRAYGEAINPARLNANGTVSEEAIEGRAWCEAIVQRVPEYFDPSVPAETAPSEFDDEETTAEKLNKSHGRRFRVVSFRWLTRSDI